MFVANNTIVSTENGLQLAESIFDEIYSLNSFIKISKNETKKDSIFIKTELFPSFSIGKDTSILTGRLLQRDNQVLINNDFFEELFDDLKLIFNITFEEVINIDFSEYTDQHYASNLFGAPSGYVGYENGGILTEPVNRYPISVVMINNFSLGHIIIRKQI